MLENWETLCAHLHCYWHTHMLCISLHMLPTYIISCTYCVADKTSPPVLPDDSNNTNPTVPCKL